MWSSGKRPIGTQVTSPSQAFLLRVYCATRGGNLLARAKNDRKFRVRISKDVICSKSGGQYILLDFRTGNFYSLNETGSEFWMLAQKGLDSEEMVRQFARRHNVARDVAKADLLELVQALEKSHLVQIRRED